MINLAKLSLSNSHSSGNRQQYAESAFWLRKLTLIEPSLSEPYFLLGTLEEYGLGTERNLRSAYNYYKKAARLENAEAISKCGDFLYSGKLTGGVADLEEAVRCYKKAAEMGCASAINNLGLMLESVNKDEAIALYRRAHKLGHLDATINFAIAYLPVSLQLHVD